MFIERGNGVYRSREAGMAWVSEDPAPASLLGLKMSEERLRWMRGQAGNSKVYKHRRKLCKG